MQCYLCTGRNDTLSSTSPARWGKIEVEDRKKCEILNDGKRQSRVIHGIAVFYFNIIIYIDVIYTFCGLFLFEHVED